MFGRLANRLRVNTTMLGRVANHHGASHARGRSRVLSTHSRNASLLPKVHMRSMPAVGASRRCANCNVKVVHVRPIISQGREHKLTHLVKTHLALELAKQLAANLALAAACAARDGVATLSARLGAARNIADQ